MTKRHLTSSEMLIRTNMLAEITNNLIDASVAKLDDESADMISIMASTHVLAMRLITVMRHSGQEVTETSLRESIDSLPWDVTIDAALEHHRQRMARL